MDYRPVGIFDSGMGGLTAVRVLREMLPGEDIAYLGDTARVPYGGRSVEELRRIAESDARFLRAREIKAMLVACGTVSSNCLGEVEATAGVPVIGVVKPAAAEAAAEKLYYDESVYRAPDSGLGFQEITQAGLEYLGRVDGYVMGEVAMLAARSLEEISEGWVLDMSHMGYLTGLVDELGLRGPERAELLRAVGSRSVQAVLAVCSSAGAPMSAAERLASLLELYGPAQELLPRLRAGAATAAELAAVEELEGTARVLESFGCLGGVNIDLSITCDTEYYNGLVFKGYVPGAPSAVLSGGRYDSLMRKLGKEEQAIGFAVYLNLLERLGGPEPEYDADVLLIPDGETPEQLASAVRELTDSGRSVRVQPGGCSGLRCRAVMKMLDGRPVELERND